MSNQKGKSNKPVNYYLKDRNKNKIQVEKKVYKAIMKIEDRIDYVDDCAQDVGVVSLDEDIEGYKKYEVELALLVDAEKEAELRRQETIAKVRALIPLLDPENRMIIELYYFQGVNQKALSSLLGIKQAAVSKHLRKARLAFLKLWYLAEEDE